MSSYFKLLASYLYYTVYIYFFFSISGRWDDMPYKILEVLDCPETGIVGSNTARGIDISRSVPLMRCPV